MATNLISPKKVDGVSKLITVADCKTIVKHADRHKANFVLKNAYDTAYHTSAQDAAPVREHSAETANIAFGRLCFRIVCLLCKKKVSIEGAGCETIDSAFDQFSKELLETVTPQNPVSTQTKKTAMEAKEVAVTSISSSSSAVHHASLGGFKVGNHYVLNDDYLGCKQPWPTIVVIKTISEDSIECEEITAMKAESDVRIFTIAHSNHKVLRPFTGNLPATLPAESFNKYLPHTNEHYKEQMLLHKCFVEYMNLGSKEKSFNINDFKYCLYPTAIIAQKEFAENTLKLYAVCPMSNLFSSQQKKCLQVQTNVFATAPAMPHKTDVAKNFLFSPFWYVRECKSDKDEFNMEVSHFLGSVHMSNTKMIKAGDELVVKPLPWIEIKRAVETSIVSAKKKAKAEDVPVTKQNS